MGTPIIFVCFLAACGIVAPFVVAYAARCVLITVQGTAAGTDRVPWPDELLYDWVIQSAALVGLTAVCVVPAGLLARALQTVWLPDQPGLRTLVLAGLVLWLCFPVGALSSLSVGSSWVMFQPVIVARMVRLWPATLVFYGISAVAGFLAVGPLYSSVVKGSLPFLLLAAPLSAALLLIYARLLGLLAWKIGKLGPMPVAARKKRRKSRRPGWGTSFVPERELTMPKPAPVVEEEPDLVRLIPQSPTGLLDEENLEPYMLVDDKAPREVRQDEPPPPRLRPLDPEEEDAKLGYAMGEVPATLRDRHPENPVNEHFRRAEVERIMAILPPPGDTVAGVLCFPWYDTSLKAWLVLSGGIALLGLLIIMCLGTIPPA